MDPSNKSVKIFIKNVKSPSCFWGTRADSCENTSFLSLKKDIKEYYGNDQIFKSILSSPADGMRCIAQVNGTSWQRAIVEACIVSPYGCRIRCFLVDKLESVILPSNRLYVSPSWVWEVGARGTKFSLHGISPACLHTDYAKDEVEIRPHSYKWDAAAINYFNTLLESCENVGYVDILYTDKDDMQHVQLHLCIAENVQISAAEILLRQRFAVPVTNKSNSSSEVKSPHRSICSSPTPSVSSHHKKMEKSLNNIQKEINECFLDETASSSGFSCSSMGSNSSSGRKLRSVLPRSHSDFETARKSNMSQSCEETSYSSVSPRESQTTRRHVARTARDTFRDLSLDSNNTSVEDRDRGSSSVSASVSKLTSSNGVGRGQRLLGMLTKVQTDESSSGSFVSAPSIVQRKPLSGFDSSGAKKPPSARKTEEQRSFNSFSRNVDFCCTRDDPRTPSRGSHVTYCKVNRQTEHAPVANSTPDNRSAADLPPILYRSPSNYSSSGNDDCSAPEELLDVPYTKEPAPSLICPENGAKDAEKWVIRPKFSDSSLQQSDAKQRNAESNRNLLKRLEKLLCEPRASDGSSPQSAAADQKVLLLEKLLHDVKNEKSSREVQTKVLQGRQSTCESHDNKMMQRPRTPQVQADFKGKPAKKAVSKQKSESFFISKSKYHSSERRDVGSMLVRGVDPPNPYPLFCKTPFPAFIIEKLESRKFRGPTQVQAHVWPAMLQQQRDIMALAPSGGGKTLAYVAPLVSLLRQQQDMTHKKTMHPLQQCHADKRSPIVTVLCSTWRNVQMVTDHFQAFFEASDVRGHHRVVGVCGGPSAEDERAVDLVAGCSVLVASPHTLLRILKAKYLNLMRLEYLVMDDIHVLVEVFTDEIRNIMKLWRETLLDPDRSESLHFKPKIMCFGIQWTAGVESFMKTFMKNDPVLYINHPLESSIYGKIRHQVHVCTRPSSYDQMLAIVQTAKKRSLGGIAVFVQSVAVVRKVSSALASSSVLSKEVNACTFDVEMQEVLKTVEEDLASAPVLVICDDALTSLDLDVIETAIHFEFAKDKYTFGLRLSSMRSFFNIDGKQALNNPSSHVFVTEEDVSEVIGLVKLLRRTSPSVPTQLLQLAQQATESREIRKSHKALCPYMKSFGKCRDANSCAFRHFISKTLDRSDNNHRYAKVPLSGHVKLRVTSVVNATLFYARVIKCKTENEVWSSSEFDEITQELEQFYGASECGKLTGFPKKNQLFAVKLAGSFYRAALSSKAGFLPGISQHASRFIQVNPVLLCDTANDVISECRRRLQAVCWKSPAGLVKLRVRLVDTGSITDVSAGDVYMLPRELATYRYQAIQVQACGVKPIDKDTEWLVAANELIHCKIYNKDIEGKVVLALGHTIWLQPVVVRSKLPKTGIHITDCDVVSELLQSGLAERNPDHMKSLLEQCEERGLLHGDVAHLATIPQQRKHEGKSNEQPPGEKRSEVAGSTTSAKKCGKLSSAERPRSKMSSARMTVADPTSRAARIQGLKSAKAVTPGSSSSASLNKVVESLTTVDGVSLDDLPPLMEIPDSGLSESPARDRGLPTGFTDNSTEDRKPERNDLRTLGVCSAGNRPSRAVGKTSRGSVCVKKATDCGFSGTLPHASQASAVLSDPLSVSRSSCGLHVVSSAVSSAPLQAAPVSHGVSSASVISCIPTTSKIAPRVKSNTLDPALPKLLPPPPAAPSAPTQLPFDLQKALSVPRASLATASCAITSASLSISTALTAVTRAANAPILSFSASSCIPSVPFPNAIASSAVISATLGISTALSAVTSAPFEDTAAPSAVASAPFEDTAAPSAVTSAPFEDAATPSATTNDPLGILTAPYAVTSTPFEDAAAPSEVTSAPLEDAAALSATTNDPLGILTAPYAVTSTPFEDAAAPSEVTSALEDAAALSATTNDPLGILTAPYAVTSTPFEDAAAPSATTSAPLDIASIPSEVVSAPFEDKAVPYEVVSACLEDAAAQSEVASAPLEDAAAPSEVISAPLEDAAVRSEVPSAPFEDVVAPSTVAIAPLLFSSSPSSSNAPPTYYSDPALVSPSLSTTSFASIPSSVSSPNTSSPPENVISQFSDKKTKCDLFVPKQCLLEERDLHENVTVTTDVAHGIFGSPLQALLVSRMTNRRIFPALTISASTAGLATTPGCGSLKLCENNSKAATTSASESADDDSVDCWSASSTSNRISETVMTSEPCSENPLYKASDDEISVVRHVSDDNDSRPTLSLTIADDEVGESDDVACSEVQILACDAQLDEMQSLAGDNSSVNRSSPEDQAFHVLLSHSELSSFASDDNTSVSALNGESATRRLSPPHCDQPREGAVVARKASEPSNFLAKALSRFSKKSNPREDHNSSSVDGPLFSVAASNEHDASVSLCAIPSFEEIATLAAAKQDNACDVISRGESSGCEASSYNSSSGKDECREDCASSDSTSAGFVEGILQPGLQIDKQSCCNLSFAESDSSECINPWLKPDCPEAIATLGDALSDSSSGRLATPERDSCRSQDITCGGEVCHVTDLSTDLIVHGASAASSSVISARDSTKIELRANPGQPLAFPRDVGNCTVSSDSATNHAALAEPVNPFLGTAADVDGLLFPICRDFALSNSEDERLRSCHELYITCSEMPCDVTERDLKGLIAILNLAKRRKETFLIFGSLLALANANVPIADFLQLSRLISLMCDHDDDVTIAQLVLSLCRLLLAHAKLDVSDLEKSAERLVDYVRHVTDDDVAPSPPPCTMTRVLGVLDAITGTCDTALQKMIDLDLALILTRFSLKDDDEEVRKSLFVKLLDASTANRLEAEKRNADANRKKKNARKRASPRSKKKFDLLDYDRFNSIQTDTDSESSGRPYTPIQTRFDTDSETCESDTETDHEHLFLGI